MTEHFRVRGTQGEPLDTHVKSLLPDLDLSCVIPVYNEEEHIAPLYRRLVKALESLHLSFEMIFVDDGSRDRSFQIVEGLHGVDPRVVGIQFRRNFGQTQALSAGFQLARGKVIVAMDGDLQYRPEEIPRLLSKIEEGYDMVSGWREKRTDHLLTRRLPSLIANRIMRLLSGVPIHDFGSTFKAYRRECIQEIRLYGELHRFIPALAAGRGALIAEVPVSVDPRPSGKSRYGLTRTWKVFLDLLAVKFLNSYSSRPLHLFGLLGLFLGGGGFLTLFTLLMRKLFLHVPFSNHEPLLMLGVLLAVLGVQFVSLGLMAELVVRCYYESQGKSVYTIRRILRDPEFGA